MIRRRLVLQYTSTLFVLAGCASMPGQEPIRVQVADLEPLAGEGLELRFTCVLRVQNPNDTPLEFRGASIDLQVRGGPFASGVADVSGTLPPFSEVLVEVPVSASAVNLARLAIGLYMGRNAERPKVDYHVRGRLGSIRFDSQGEIPLPTFPGGGAPALPS